MPSLLSCFCVRQRRHVFSSRKRESKKKILKRNSDWISDTSSDLYKPVTPQTDADYPFRSPRPTQSAEQKQDADILAKLLESQTSPRRRHVEEIFRADRQNAQRSLPDLARQQPERLQPLPHVYRNVVGSNNNVESMYGYVPKAVGQLSASTALSGQRVDDFFSDCRLHTALGKFANPTDFGARTHDYYTIDRNEKRPSIIQVGTTGNMNMLNTSAHDSEEKVSHFDDIFNDNFSLGSDSTNVSEDGFTFAKTQPVFMCTNSPVAYRNSSISDDRIEHMFECDGDILY